MKSHSVNSIALSVLLVASSGAHAQIQYLTQERSVSAVTTAMSDAHAATDFSPFTASAFVEDLNESSFGSASQDSTLGDMVIAASGGASADALNAFPAGASSDFEVTFQISQPLEFAFVGSIFSSSVGSDISFSFTGPDGEDVVFLGFTDDFEFIQFADVTGTLQPGEYRLAVFATGFSGGEIDGAGDYDFTLTVSPAPGASVVLLSGLAFLTRRRRA